MTSLTALPLRRQFRLSSQVMPLLREASELLRVSKEPGTSTDPEFTRWVETQKFRSPQTGNDVQFKSLPPDEQAKIRARWQQAKSQEAQKQPTQGAPEAAPRKKEENTQQAWEGVPQAESKAFKKWLSGQSPDSQKSWETPGNDQGRSSLWGKFKKDRAKAPTTSDAIEAERKRVESETPEQKAQGQKKQEESEKQLAKDRQEFLKTPRDQRPNKWVPVDKGNSLWGRAEIGDNTQVSGSQVAGTIDGKASVKKSKVMRDARVSGDANVAGSEIHPGGVVEDNASISNSTVSNARVRGDSKISDADIRGGSWDGQTLNGNGGTFHNAWDQDTLDILSRVGPREKGTKGPGDGPLMAMTKYFEDGGRTKGWLGLGKDLDQKKLTQRIQDHIYQSYDRKDPWLGRGASFIDDIPEQDFGKLMEVAQREADRRKAEKRNKKAMLYQLTKTALEQPELRAGLLPLVRLGQTSRVASGMPLRAIAIRTAFETKNPKLKKAIVQCLVAADKMSAEAPPIQERAMRPDERRNLVRAAYVSKDQAERLSLLKQLKQADARHDELIETLSVERSSWEAPFAITASERKTLVRVAYETQQVVRRREILGLLKEAKYTPGFMKYVEKQQWKHPDTGNMVQFVSLPSAEQTKIHDQWKTGKKDWAQQFKPEGLDQESSLTPEKFDKLKPGDRLWISWAPHVEHKVVGLNKTKTGKPVLEMVMVDPTTGAEGETRYLHRSSAGNPKHDIHVLPLGAKPKNPKEEAAKAEAKPPSESKKKSPEEDPFLPKPQAALDNHPFIKQMGGDGLHISDKDSGFKRGTKVRATSKSSGKHQDLTVLSDKIISGSKGDFVMAEGEKGITLIPLEGVTIEPHEKPKSEKPKSEKADKKPDQKELEGLFAEQFYDPDSFKRTNKPTPFAQGTTVMIFDDSGFGDSTVSILDGSLYNVDGEPYIAIEDAKYGKSFIPADTKMQLAEAPKAEAPKAEAPKAEAPKAEAPKAEAPKAEAPKAEAPKAEAPKAEAPKVTGKHKDRKRLVGKGKPDTTPVPLTAEVKDAFVPEGLDAEAKAATEKGFKGITFAGLKQLGANVQAAVDNPEGAYAKALEGSGYKPGDLSKMHKTIKDLVKGMEGRAYHKTVLEIANKYDLEGEDADELYDFKADKPPHGRALSPQELFNKFLSKAAPETKERMQGMNIKDFMAMYNAIMADEEEELA